MNDITKPSFEADVAARYAAASDEALLSLVLESDQLESFAMDALLAELERRNAPAHYFVAARRVAKPLTAAERDDLTNWVRAKPCSKCGVKGLSTNAVSFVPFDRRTWQAKRPLGQVEWIACKPCIRSQILHDALPTLGRALVDLPWSFPLLWFTLLRNAAALATTFRDRPSSVLVRYVERNRARLILELAREMVPADGREADNDVRAAPARAVDSIEAR